MAMEQEEKWNRFVATGKVEDYLRYRQQEDRDVSTGTRAVNSSREDEMFQVMKVRRNHYGRCNRSDGNGADGISHQGI